MTYKILIVEDHLVVKDGFEMILGSEEHIEIIGSLDKGDLVLPFLSQNEVDLILLDINLPDVDGITLTPKIKKSFPNIRILALTFYNKAAFIQGMLEAGADGYLLKNSSKEEVISAIHKVLSGETYVSSEANQTLLKSMQRQGTDHVAKLTKREIEVMILLAKAFTVNEVAEQLFISSHTADTHRKNIMAKLKLKNKADLAVYAKEHGYLDLKS